MTKLEKVIKGLRCIKGDTIPCRDCDYADVDGYGNYSCKINCAIDAIELLKEHEDFGTELTHAVELIHKKNERIKKLLKEQESIEPICQIIFDVPYYFCGSCKTMLNMYAVKAKYCSQCGRQMKWK